MLFYKKNLQSIQTLRCIACLLVVFMHIAVTYYDTYHLPFLGNAFNFGGAGVDIFFVLSGFIITYSNTKSLTKPADIGKYLKKRIIRIFPIYWVIISIFLLLQVVLPFFYRTHFQYTVTNLLNTYLLLPNHTMLNGVSWSLTNELFFYLLFIVALLIPKKNYILLLFFIYLAFLILFPTVFNIKNTTNNFTFLLLFPMNIEFLLGIIVVLCIDKLPLKWCIPFLILGIVLFIIAAIFTNNGNFILNNAYNRVILYGLPSFIIILALVKYELNNHINIPSLFLKLGDASYSIYLFHLPLVAAFFKIAFKLHITNYLVILLLSSGLVIAICYIGITIYNKIEIPLIKWFNKKLI